MWQRLQNFEQRLSSFINQQRQQRENDREQRLQHIMDEVDTAIREEQKNKAGQLLGIDLHGVTIERWAEFANDVLEQSQNDRELIFLADIVQGGTTRHVTRYDRISAEYRTLKDRVRNKWYEWNNNNIS